MSKIITTRSVKWVVGAVDEPVFSDDLTSVGIIDDGDGEGEFVQVSQSYPNGITMHVNISPDKWPELQNAINHAIRMCQEVKA